MRHFIGSISILMVLGLQIMGCAETGDATLEATPSLIVTPASELDLVEGGRGATLEILTNVAPSSELKVRITADDTSQVRLSTNELKGYFYPQAKQVEVNCVQDNVADNGRVVTLIFEVSGEDPAYHGARVVRQVVCHDDSVVPVAGDVDDFCPDDPDKTNPGVCGCNVPDSAANTALTEDGYPSCVARYAAYDAEEVKRSVEILPPDETALLEKDGVAAFAVGLSYAPMADVVIPVYSNDESEGVTDVSELVFTPDNWMDPQIVTITSVDDDDPDGDQAFSVILGPTASDDEYYNGLVIEPISMMTLDDEEAVAAELVVSTHDIMVHEGGTSGELYVSLSKSPFDADMDGGEVTVKLVSDDAKEASVSPAELVFTQDNWDVPQVVLIKASKDGILDGNKEVHLNISSDSNEICGSFACYLDRVFDPVVVTVVDIDAATNTKQKDVIRIMAANTTSGSKQSYDPGEGIRIFKGLKPDIVLIQEFNYNKGTIAEFVQSTFGAEYSYVRGTGDIPNGIISRYPIVQSGAWDSNQVKNRKWDWAVIDIPGDRDLLAVSVHLHTSSNASEMGPLRNKIDKKLASDNRDYYVVLGGDFNQPKWNSIQTNFASLFTVGKNVSDWPMDQEGKIGTNAKRAKQYDYLLCSHDLCKLETPTIIGSHSYPKGHVVDSRVYNKKNELKDISPVQAKDSGASNMQHMAVVRDFEIKY